MEEKEIPYELEYVNLDKKPDWLNDVSNGKVPVIKDLNTGMFIADSSTIVDYLEEKFGPEAEITKKHLGKMDDCPQPGRQVMSAFFDYMGDENKRGDFEACLKEIEGTINNQNPFVAGKDVCAYDMMMAPMLYIARVGCKKFKNWDFADDYPEIKSYLHRMTGRPSWRNAISWDEESIVEDLSHKLEEQEK